MRQGGGVVCGVRGNLPFSLWVVLLSIALYIGPFEKEPRLPDGLGVAGAGLEGQGRRAAEWCCTPTPHPLLAREHRHSSQPASALARLG